MGKRLSSILKAVPRQKAPGECHAPFGACKYRQRVLEILVVAGLAGSPFVLDYGQERLGIPHAQSAEKTFLMAAMAVLLGAAGAVGVGVNRRERARAREAREGGERLEAVLRVVGPVAIHPVDAPQDLHSNAQLAQLLGYEEQEVRALGAMGVLDPESRGAVRDRLASGAEGNFEATLRRKDGSGVPVAVSTRVADIGGRAYRIVHFADVSRLRRREQDLEKERERLAELGERLSRAHLLGKSGFAVIDPAGMEIEISPELLVLLGDTLRKPGPAERRPVRMPLTEYARLCHPEDVKVFMEHVGRSLSAAADEIGEFQHRAMRKDGECRLRVVWKKRRDGTVRTYQQDVTELHKAQQELVTQMRAAEAAGQAKGDFLARMSHELRTPLNAVIGFPQVMFPDLDAAQDAHDPQERNRALARVRENLGYVLGAGDYLLRLINDVLDMSKIEAGKMAMANVAFRADDEIRAAMALFCGPGADKGGKVAFSCEFPDGPPPTTMGDPVRFRQVMVNLVGNAAKFTEAGSVRVVARHRRGDHGVGFEICVHDTGCGIADEDMGKLFSPFEQARSNLKNSLKGTGLGLAISRSLAQMMYGDVTAASEPGEGSTFTFRCVLAPAAESSAAPADKPEAVPRLRILVAEDDAISRVLAERMLSDLGQDVTTVPDGADVVPALEKNAYDLVFLDGQMTTVHGDEAARAVLAHPDERIRKTPLLALTASGTEEHPKYLEAGMREVVTKPIAPHRLAGVIVKYGQAAREARSAGLPLRP